VYSNAYIIKDTVTVKRLSKRTNFVHSVTDHAERVQTESDGEIKFTYYNITHTDS